MARTKRGVVSRAKHKKVLKSVKGQYGRKKYNSYSSTGDGKSNAVRLSRSKSQKREFRSLWIQRINAGVRAEG